jgi:hypothetical protein
MANMSYCRWENTAHDLADCVEAFEEEGQGLIHNLFDEREEYGTEWRGFNRVIELARRIVDMADSHDLKVE